MAKKFYLAVEEGNTSFVKVGQTGQELPKRKAQLQTGNPRKLEVFYELEHEKAYEIEKRLKLFLKEREAPGGDDWYRVSPAYAKELALLEKEGLEVEEGAKKRRLPSNYHYRKCIEVSSFPEINYVHPVVGEHLPKGIPLYRTFGMLDTKGSVIAYPGGVKVKVPPTDNEDLFLLEYPKEVFLENGELYFFFYFNWDINDPINEEESPSFFTSVLLNILKPEWSWLKSDLLDGVPNFEEPYDQNQLNLLTLWEYCSKLSQEQANQLLSFYRDWTGEYPIETTTDTYDYRYYDETLKCMRWPDEERLAMIYHDNAVGYYSWRPFKRSYHH